MGQLLTSVDSCKNGGVGFVFVVLPSEPGYVNVGYIDKAKWLLVYLIIFPEVNNLF